MTEAEIAELRMLQTHIQARIADAKADDEILFLAWMFHRLDEVSKGTVH